MRVTQSLNQTQFLSALDSLESNLSQTQNQISSGVAFTSPSQNPIAAGTVNNYDQVLAQSKQYTANGNSAQTSLQTEGQRTVAIAEANCRACAASRSRPIPARKRVKTSTAIAEQATQIQNSSADAGQHPGRERPVHILRLRDRKRSRFRLDRERRELCRRSGSATKFRSRQDKPLPSGDNGDAVFNQIKTGNGTFTVAANAGNTGTGVLGATTVSGAAGYSGKTYSISFTRRNAYQVRRFDRRLGHLRHLHLGPDLELRRRAGHPDRHSPPPATPSVWRRAAIRAYSRRCRISSTPCRRDRAAAADIPSSTMPSPPR